MLQNLSMIRVHPVLQTAGVLRNGFIQGKKVNPFIVIFAQLQLIEYKVAKAMSSITVNDIASENRD
jgi:hypothetical protein